MKHNIKRGDIYFVDFDETIGSVQSGLRPVVVIQNNIGNKHSTTLIVATITSKSKKNFSPLTRHLSRRASLL